MLEKECKGLLRHQLFSLCDSCAQPQAAMAKIPFLLQGKGAGDHWPQEAQEAQNRHSVASALTAFSLNS